MTPEAPQSGGLLPHEREPLRTLVVATGSVAIVLAGTASSILCGLAIGDRLRDGQGGSGNGHALQALRADAFPHGAIDRQSPFTLKSTP
jgi:hypothetical protein